MIFMKLFARFKTMSSRKPDNNQTEVKSIYDNNGELYDTLSIDCSDNIDDVMDSVESIDACEDMVDYYDE
ncbi:MAG: hypothetical protein IJZ09_02180 [Tidjanibacter sp.]|nr:hypothetical protein [Tidjanibacter sp.]